MRHRLSFLNYLYSLSLPYHNGSDFSINSKKHLIFWWNKRSNFITLQIYHNFCLLAAFHDCTVFTYFQHYLYQNFVSLYLNMWSAEYRFKINILSFFNKLSVFLIPSQMNFGSEQNFYFHNCIIYIYICLYQPSHCYFIFRFLVIPNLNEMKECSGTYN